jgi:hypothetical protein
MDIVGKGRMEIDLLGAAEQTNADIVITARSTATRHLALGGLEVRQTRLDPGGSHAHFDEPV